MPLPDSAASTRFRGTQACTTAEIAKPSTSAHQTSHAIRKAFERPSPVFERTSPMLRLYQAGVCHTHAMATNTGQTRGYTASKDQLRKRLARIEGQVRGVARMVEE